MSILPFIPLLDGLIGLGKEFITDKDKQIEFEYKALEVRNELASTLLETTTTPFVDGTVKLLYAFIALARPLGMFAMTLFGMYAHFKGIQIDTGMHLMLDGAFPAWAGSRHVNKQKEQEEKTKRTAIRAKNGHSYNILDDLE